LKINRFEVGKIDFLRDTARVNIYYYEDENFENLADDDDITDDDDED
jgi:hypothetical protein